jgi:aerobic carbon-monoxide dehydrogenase large subunit
MARTPNRSWIWGAYQAADAVEAVQVGYDRLRAVVDMMAALAPEAPLVHADKGTNRAFTWWFTAGDYEGAKRRAKVVVSRRFVQQRLLPAALEPRAMAADPTPATGEFTLWTSTQVPHFVRILMSSVCGIPEQKLRVIAPYVGGGFGGKLNVYAEEAIALAVARRLGRPVKWIATRGLSQMVSLIEWPEFQSTSGSAPQKPAVSASHFRSGSAVIRLKRACNTSAPCRP